MNRWVAVAASAAAALTAFIVGLTGAPQVERVIYAIVIAAAFLLVAANARAGPCARVA